MRLLWKLMMSLIPVMLLGVTAGCGDRALFDELATNRLKVVIKGTYESNNPKAWTGTFPYDPYGTDSTFNEINPNPTNPTTFMMDIASMDLVGGDSDPFAIDRETYTFTLSDSEPFFNGTGVVFQNDDPFPYYTYNYVNVFIRKLIFDNAKTYLYSSGSWVDQGAPAVVFEERDVYGFDFNQVLVNSYWDSLRTDYEYVNRVFPLAVPIYGGLFFNNEKEATVLEIRLVIKNFVKYFEYSGINDDGVRQLYHYWGPSDWLRKVKADEDAVGRNLHAVARVYVPGETVTLTGTAGGTNRYVIAIEGSDVSPYNIANRDRPTSTYDPPKPPVVNNSNDIEAILDYYLKFEKYKETYNPFVDQVDSGAYAAQWDAYEAKVSGYLIPPLATFTGSGSTFTITEVPVGKTYYLFQADGTGLSAGALPGDSSGAIYYNSTPLNPGGTYIDPSKAGQVITIP